MEEIGKTMILFGAIFFIVGAVILLIGKIPGLGRLPGDIVIQSENFSCFFPIATSILLSIVLTLYSTSYFDYSINSSVVVPVDMCRQRTPVRKYTGFRRDEDHVARYSNPTGGSCSRWMGVICGETFHFPQGKSVG